MEAISHSYDHSIAYTTTYIKNFMTATVTTSLARVDKVLADMVSGAKTAQCM